MAAVSSCDVAIVGGGLAGGLIALALRHRRPDVDLRLIEPEGPLGGNHIWSFFTDDIVQGDRWLVRPLVCWGWQGYDVAFPGHARTLRIGYHAIDSARFDRVVRAALAPGQLVARRAIGVGTRAVVLADGDRIEAKGVIDARGAADLSMLDLGWQKFMGRELALAQPHGERRPIVMDATVMQEDGYRFIYTLPLSPDAMFVEDTCYSDTPAIDPAAFADRIADYAATRGWRVTGTARDEQGVLPVAMGGDFATFWRTGGAGLAKAGVRAGLFHPTTGYALPDAVRLANAVARASDLSSAALHDLTHGMAARAWRDRRFYRVLNTMLFRAAEPRERYRVLERFYRLPPALIARFYAGHTTMMDKARILTGRPPVPVGRALAAIAGGRK